MENRLQCLSLWAMFTASTAWTVFSGDHHSSSTEDLPLRKNRQQKTHLSKKNREEHIHERRAKMQSAADSVKHLWQWWRRVGDALLKPHDFRDFGEQKEKNGRGKDASSGRKPFSITI
ncbi:uncharacterized protein G2W53_004345 [Senna tora]|uniref:Uncharacterized protein n=1 Tax=Senna tora TaxID=362788 RepID=A0A834XCX5_9FABA|nr:uncharacterized protein G2W53_004345 [Senna tora]